MFNLNAQTIEEPEFIGESILLRSDNSSTLLEKQLTQNRKVASTGLILSGLVIKTEVRSKLSTNVVIWSRVVKLVLKAINLNNANQK